MKPLSCDEEANALISVLFPNPEDRGIHYTSLVNAYLSYKVSDREQVFELSEEQWAKLRKSLQTAPKLNHPASAPSRAQLVKERETQGGRPETTLEPSE